MDRRPELHDLLKNLLGTDHVYFDPPENLKMVYPAIVYNRDFQNARFGDNIPYSRRRRYQITIIDPNADSVYPEMVAEMPLTTFVRHFTTEGLHHDVYDAYF